METLILVPMMWQVVVTAYLPLPQKYYLPHIYGFQDFEKCMARAARIKGHVKEGVPRIRVACVPTDRREA